MVSWSRKSWVRRSAAGSLLIPEWVPLSVGGGTLVSGGSGVGFRSFDVDALSEVTKTERRFSGTHPDYNPRDPYFAHILRQV